MNWRTIIEDSNPEALFIGEPGDRRFDEAIVGIGERCGQPALPVYDYDRIVRVFVKDGMTEEEAREHVDFNIAGGWLGPNTPIILYRHAEWDGGPEFPLPPTRIQLRRVKGWRLPSNTVKVCRPARWGNRYRIGVSVGGMITRDREHAVKRYEQWLKVQPKLLTALVELRGKNLACWCPLDQPCHADVLLKLANA